MRRVAIVIATAGGAGYAPVASGTFGAAVGLVLFILTRHWPAAWQVALVVLVSVVGIWASKVAAEHFGREDPGQVVIDEVAGQLVTLLLLDVHVAGAAAGFLLFRAFDIVKPWPARQFEDLPHGFGVMADDLMAGVYSWICLALLVRFVPLPW
jgi:phosphatidylglycerophosphatase A